MANFVGTRTCNDNARVTNIEEARKVFGKYEFPDMYNASVGDDGVIQIYGDEWLQVIPAPPETCDRCGLDNYECECTERWDNDILEDFLQDIQPYIETELIIQMIGKEKCIYPLAAIQVKVTKDRIVWRTLDEDDAGLVKQIEHLVWDIRERAGDDKHYRDTFNEGDPMSVEQIWEELYFENHGILWSGIQVGRLDALIKTADFLGVVVPNEYREFKEALMRKLNTKRK